MTDTTPYLPEAVRRVPLGVPHVVRAQVWHPILGGFTLDITRGSVTFDEGWTPHVQGRLTVPDPGPERRWLLDGKLEPIVIIEAGYVFGDVEDVHELAQCLLVDARIDRPGDTIELVVESVERVLLDDAPTFEDSDDDFAVYPAGMVIRDIIADIVLDVAGIVLDVAPDVPATALAADVTLRAGDDYWDFLVDLTDRLDAWLYWDGSTFRLRRRPDITGRSSAQLIAGRAPRANVIESTTTSGRDGFANVVVIRYADNRFTLRKALGAPHGADFAPRKVLTLERDKMPADGGGAAAEAILARAFSRGAGVDITAPAFYWMRPGQTFTAELPEGAERHLLARVTFDLGAGTMSIASRRPEAYLTGTTEG